MCIMNENSIAIYLLRNVVNLCLWAEECSGGEITVVPASVLSAEQNSDVRGGRVMFSIGGYVGRCSLL